MKKIKFLNGISAACTFAVVAMIGSLLFTSCEKEDLKATFEAGPAEITFNVKVFDVLSGDVTSNATITGADKISEVGGYKGGKVTISATYDGVTGSTEVVVNPLKAGGTATYDVNVVLSSTYKVTSKVVKTETEIGNLQDATHSHNGNMWSLNDNEYILVRDVKYTIEHNQTATASEGAADFVRALAEGLAYNASEETVLNVKVSAWAYYRVWTTRMITTTEYTVARENGEEVFGVITAKAVSSTAAEFEETAFNSHYHYGHGHGHGSGNAGGGIVYPD